MQPASAPDAPAGYGIDDRGMASAVFRHTSQQHNVKLQEVAAAFVFAQRGGGVQTARTSAARHKTQASPLAFCPQGTRSGPPRRRSEVLQALMRATQAGTGAPHMTVQAGDRLFGGLRIEAHRGFERPFVNFFGYLDAIDDSACASALAHAQPVVVDDVETSPLYDESSRRAMLDGGSRAVLSVPVVDAENVVRGVVSAHYTTAGVTVDEKTLDLVQLQARECAQWLRWHDSMVLPTVINAVHLGRARGRADLAPPAAHDLPRRGHRRRRSRVDEALRTHRRRSPCGAGEAGLRQPGSRGARGAPTGREGRCEIPGAGGPGASVPVTAAPGLV